MSKKQELNAEELAELIDERRLKNKQRHYEAFRAKCLQNISKMAADLENEVTVDLTDDDLSALIRVTEELRSLNYKFKFIEVVDSSNNIKTNKLLISIAHLTEEQ